jgi:beta-galactosidase
LRCAALGFNTITVYANWAIFEPTPGAWDVSGPNDMFAFIQLAWEKYGLLCICRIGPYITAETDFGGFPWWLSTVEPMELRSLNATYLRYVDRYFDRLIPYIAPLQYANGGPIVLVQVEDDTTIRTSSVADNRAYYKYLVEGVKKRGLTTLVNTLCYPTVTGEQFHLFLFFSCLL